MSTNLIREFSESSQLAGGNADYVEQLYESWLADPGSVPADWAGYFETFKGRQSGDVPHSGAIARIEAAQKQRHTAAAGTFDDAYARKQAGVLRLLTAYRSRGHLAADLDPLGLAGKMPAPDLGLAFHGLSDADLDTEFDCGTYAGGGQRMKLRELLARLKKVYTGTIGAEFMYISDHAQRSWIYTRLEQANGSAGLDKPGKLRVLEGLTAAEGLERYLHTKYVGQKRFSLEGGDSLIPMVDDVITAAGDNGIKELVLGMAHRGRLNVLVNILGKPPKTLFNEFEGKFEHPDDPAHSGDVKYHMGFSADVRTPHGNGVHVALAFNPSHLEIVNPVVCGSVHARQARSRDTEHTRSMAVLVHGDAAFAGQGVNMELLNMSQARGFRTGGSLHIVINNQVGFTTSNPQDARSTMYCTDLAKMINAPVLHVNGDDPEAVIEVTRLAYEFRKQFRRDVVIDLVCYRRHGHNEADEPAATQPLMYQIIRKRPTARDLYQQQLVKEGVLAEGDAARQLDAYRDRLEAGEPMTELQTSPVREGHVDWSRFNGKLADTAKTTVAEEEADRAGQAPARPAAGPDPAVTRGQDLRRPPQDGRRRAAGRLGLCREPGLRHVDRRGPQPAPGRPGFGPRHLLPPPRGAARPEGRPHLHAAGDDPRWRQRRGDRLAAQRGGGDGLRVRPLHHRSGHAAHLGSPVRRLRQRRAGGDRPVHQFRRGQVEPRCAGWPCTCRTATKARVRSTPPPAWSASCSCARWTTCRCACRPPRRRIST